VQDLGQVLGPIQSYFSSVTDAHLMGLTSIFSRGRQIAKCKPFASDREDDFAELLALFQAPVRLNRFG
jgi:hypothetical protein